MRLCPSTGTPHVRQPLTISLEVGWYCPTCLGLSDTSWQKSMMIVWGWSEPLGGTCDTTPLTLDWTLYGLPLGVQLLVSDVSPASSALSQSAAWYSSTRLLCPAVDVVDSMSASRAGTTCVDFVMSRMLTRPGCQALITTLGSTSG